LGLESKALHDLHPSHFPKKTMNTPFRDQLLEAAERAAYPAEPVLDETTGVVALDADSAAVVARVFELFGVTALQAGDADIDRVLNTACTLSAEVAVHVHSLTEVNGDLAALPESENWHEDYRAYISALWQGDRDGITRQASALGLAAGIPNGSLPLHDGPVG
jgi:hypothetical protein